MNQKEIVKNILIYIDKNINKKISINDLSNEVFFNKDYIMRVFKKYTKITIIEYINMKRIYNSLESIKNTNDSFIKISIENGFSSAEYFSETFTKYIGTNPNNYRLFTKTTYGLDYEVIYKIRVNIVEIKNKLETIDKIKQYNKYHEQVKVLSIFK